MLFSSDNGGERFSYYWPLSGGKGNLNEGGIRVPNILRWPARLRSHQVSHEPVVTQDWTATLLELAGARPDPAYPGDGVSLAGYLLRGDRAPARDLFWRTHDAGRCAAATGSSCATRPPRRTPSSTSGSIRASRPTARPRTRPWSPS
ncbi:sulfatase-like hydrolase/transferase [Paractinoplanes durhamensis]|uniref:sulfatase-like hydrolase/transferase n=1 Tax=Paractinoplanes durhamensis TaxID=113563 RepID=UPI0036371E03